MRKFIMLILGISLFTFYNIAAQDNRPMRHNAKAQEKIAELEKIKLVEALDVNEETMVKFFARRKDFLEKMKALNMQKEDKLDLIEKELQNNEGKNDQVFKRYVDEAIGIESNIVRTKKEFYDSLKDIFNNRQIAKLMVFERNFRREIRDMILKERGRKTD